MGSLAEQAWLAEASAPADVRGFFDALGVELGREVGDEISVRCFANPTAHQHDDRVKSCSINMLTGVWKCHGCGEEGNAYFAAIALGRSELEARRLAKSYGLFIERAGKREKPKLPNENDLKRWRKQLWANAPMVERLAELKAWTPVAIRRLGLGWDGERVIFPIRTNRLKIQGVARYLPGGSPKMLAAAGTKRGLFPAPEIIGRKRTLFVVEGEPDAVSLWSAGVPAVAVPGAQSWRPEWARRLDGRRLIVMCDCDKPGRDLAATIGELPNAMVVDLEPSRDDGWDVGELVREAAAEGGVWQARFLMERLASSSAGAPALSRAGEKPCNHGGLLVSGRVGEAGS